MHPVLDSRLFLPVAAALVLGVGLVIDVVWGGGFFPRSGAVLVCLAIFGVSRSERLATKARNAGEFISAEMQIAGEKASMTYRVADWTQEPAAIEAATKDAEKLEAANNLFWDNHERISNLTRISSDMLRQQIFVALTGTLVWAFGDLLTNLIFHCQQIVC